MRIAFIGRSHDFSLIPAQALAEYFGLVGIVEDVGKPAENRLRRVAHSLRRSALADHLRTIRSDAGAAGSLRQLSRRFGAPRFELNSQTRSGLGAFLEAIRPDIVCVASLHWLIRPDELEIPRLGFINLHPSMLPAYHGPMPWFWQYHDQQLDIGVTVHRLDAGQDTGPIILQEKFALELGCDIKDAIRPVSAVGARLMCSAVLQLGDGGALLQAHSLNGWPKARVIRPDERFIDWSNWPLERVWHFMRGTYPWSQACDYPPKLGRWPRIGMMRREARTEAPGTVITEENQHLLVHRDGVIEIHPTLSRLAMPR